MQPVVTEWIRRILGYGAAAASGAVATKVGDPELGMWVGSGVALVGGYILNKALPILFPTTRKVIATQQTRPK